MGIKVGNQAITNITNVSLLTRYQHLAVALEVVVDGTTIPGDGVLQRGTILVPSQNAGKWRPYVKANDTLAADQIRIQQDDLKVQANQDVFCSAFSEGFFRLSTLVDANTGLLATDLSTAAGFHAAGQDEVRLK